MIKRGLLDKLIEHMQQKEITLITGARQTGKTTIMQELRTQLEAEGSRTLNLNYDIESDLPYFASQKALLSKVELEIGDEGYVFLDEIQRKENAGLFLKGLYDSNLKYKFIVTGSGSIELKEKIHESLAGRKRMYELSPVSFHEYCDYRTQYKYSDRLNKYLGIEQVQAKIYFDEYLQFGGYPRVITSKTREEKIRTLDEIYRSHAERDIVNLLNVERPESFTLLLKLLAAQNGQLINISDLARDSSLNVQTVKKYLYFAEKTFLIHIVHPYFNNIVKEITKSSVVYFNDLGLLNYIKGTIDTSVHVGFTFQNYVYQILRDKTNFTTTNIHFWRTTDKAEVDFVVDYKSSLMPVEVKYSTLKRPEITRSFRSFIEKYKPQKALIVNLAYEDNLKIDDTMVTFVPYYKLGDYL